MCNTDRRQADKQTNRQTATASKPVPRLSSISRQYRVQPASVLPRWTFAISVKEAKFHVVYRAIMVHHSLLRVLGSCSVRPSNQPDMQVLLPPHIYIYSHSACSLTEDVRLANSAFGSNALNSPRSAQSQLNGHSKQVFPPHELEQDCVRPWAPL